MVFFDKPVFETTVVIKIYKFTVFSSGSFCQIYRVTDEALIAETMVWPSFFLTNVFFALKGSKLFIIIINVLPVPISTVNLGHYIAFFSSKLTFSSVRQYLNIVRLLHLKAGQPNALSQSWYLTSILNGCRRKIGDRVKQKLPITVDILKGILSVLDFAKPFDLCFWAACLIASSHF